MYSNIKNLLYLLKGSFSKNKENYPNYESITYVYTNISYNYIRN